MDSHAYRCIFLLPCGCCGFFLRPVAGGKLVSLFCCLLMLLCLLQLCHHRRSGKALFCVTFFLSFTSSLLYVLSGLVSARHHVLDVILLVLTVHSGISVEASFVSVLKFMLEISSSLFLKWFCYDS